MASLYRSSTMSYVRLLMTEEGAGLTIRQLGHWGHLHVVDLSSSTPAATFSERITRLKKRISTAQCWEKRLDSLRDLMPDYGVELPLEDEVEVREATAGDVLDGGAGFVEPMEAAISKHILFKREQERAIGAMTEQLHVLDAVLHPTKTRQQRAQDAKARDEERSAAHNTTATSDHIARAASAQSPLPPPPPRLRCSASPLPSLVCSCVQCGWTIRKLRLGDLRFAVSAQPHTR